LAVELKFWMVLLLTRVCILIFKNILQIQEVLKATPTILY